MTRREKLSEPLLERVAKQFKSLGEPNRLRLMNLLFDGERTVGELVDMSGLSLANVSKHLGLLHQVGWVTRRKDGLSVVYALADERTFVLCDIMCSRVKALTAAEAALVHGSSPRRKQAN